MCLHKDDSYLSVQATHAQTCNFLRCVVQLVYGRQNIFTENKLPDIYRKQSSTINIKKKNRSLGSQVGAEANLERWRKGARWTWPGESTGWTKSPPGVGNPSPFQTWPLASQE